MGENTLISWTDKTFNPQIGCNKVSPGCDNCYAEARNDRFKENHWGVNAPRHITSDGNWKLPARWNRKAVDRGEPYKVFCGSLCDWADKSTPPGVHDRLWQMIRKTPMLRWQLLTKRAPNIAKYLPADWEQGYMNVWLGVTVENQKHGLKRVDVLREIPARVRFLSVEPLLEDLGDIDLTGIHWVIVGGESGPNCRRMDWRWVMNIHDQCHEQNVPFFFKQWGGNTPDKGGSLLNGKEVKNWPIERI